METTAFVVFLAGVLTAASVAVREGFRAKRLSTLREMATVEENRNRFGELRTRMMTHVREGRIDVRSDIFRTVYRTLTLLMKHPHKHRDAATEILRLPDPATATITGERPMQPEEISLVLDFSRRLDLLCRDFSGTYRLLAKLEDVSSGVRAEGRVPLWVRIADARLRRARAPEKQVLPAHEAGRRLATIGSRGFWPTVSPSSHASAAH